MRLECMKRPIENNSKPNDRVYEPFSGSGNTIIAGLMTGRKVHAIKLSPTYVDMAVMRWEQCTGKPARRESDGLTFAEATANPMPTKAKAGRPIYVATAKDKNIVRMLG